MCAARARALARDLTGAAFWLALLNLGRQLAHCAAQTAASAQAATNIHPLCMADYSLLAAALSVRNIAMASISISSSGRQRCA